MAHRREAICLPRRAFLAITAGGLLAAPLAAEAPGAPKSLQGRLFRRIFCGSDAAEHGGIQRKAAKPWLGEGAEHQHRDAVGRRQGDRLQTLAADLVALGVDVIVTQGSPATRAAKQVTTTISIVMWNTTDPVGQGFVASLAKPGGNITGLSDFSGELSPSVWRS